MKAVIVALSMLIPNQTWAPVRSYTAVFHSCFDGDTCYFDFHLSASVGLGISLGAVMPKQGLRLCDIDAPEISGGTVETKAAAKVARDTLSKWLSEAKILRVDIPQKNNCDPAIHYNCDQTEKYGRWLGYIYADGVNLNQKLLGLGLVKPMVSSVTGLPITCL